MILLLLLLPTLLLVTLDQFTTQRPPAGQVVPYQPQPLALCIKVAQRLLRGGTQQHIIQVTATQHNRGSTNKQLSSGLVYM
jgi:hypothetical protein